MAVPGRTGLALLWLVSNACGGEQHESAPRDMTAPRAVDSTPRERAHDVPSSLESLRITFDEPMNGAFEGVLSAGGLDVPLAASWSADATSVSFPIPEPLAPSTVHRLDLRALRDAAGNALDPAPYLGDGVLDFTTSGGDVPHVVSSDPEEGALAVDPLLTLIALTFSEPMDASRADVLLAEGGDQPHVVTGLWSDDGRALTVELAGFLAAGSAVHVDVRELRDVDRNAVDATHPYLENGILDFVLAEPSGEDCAEPLVLSQAAQGSGFSTWHVPPATVSQQSGVFGCDPLPGPDAVIEYAKTSDDLLHVIGLAQEGELNLAITSGDCSTGIVEKCVSGKDSWDAFLDVPAGTYWIWLSGTQGSGAGFPGAIVSVEEIPATAPQAQGEGCFAPYTTASANYTPPATSGAPHVWTIPTTINSFDVAKATSGSGTLGCSYASGVDAVIELQKAPSTNTLLIEGFGMFAVLDGCDALDASTNMLECWRAGLGFTTIPPEGPAYIWVDPVFPYGGGAVSITELTLATGEAPIYAEPLAGSGPINPSSTVGYEVPACLEPVAGLHWYGYVATDTLFGVRADAPGGVVVIDASGRAACSFDTTTVAVGRHANPGDPLLIAVETPTAITHLQIIEDAYQGVAGTVTELGITFPTPVGSAEAIALGANDIFISSNHTLWSFPKSGNATAVPHDAAFGLTSAQLGDPIAFAAGKLFTADSISSTNDNRVFVVYDEATSLWGPTPWDLPSGWPPSVSARAMTYDGVSLVVVTNGNPKFISIDPTTAPATPMLLGENDAALFVRGIAADASHFYVADSGTGLYRFERANLASPPLLLVSTYVSSYTSVVVDDLTAAHNVYLGGEMVARPGHATPIYLGAIGSGAHGDPMTIDRASNTLYMRRQFMDTMIAVQ